MIFTNNITHNTGGLLIGFVPVITQLLHGIQHPPVNRLQTIPDIRQGPTDNDTHGILEIGLTHLLLDTGHIAFVLNHPELNAPDLNFFLCTKNKYLYLQTNGV